MTKQAKEMKDGEMGIIVRWSIPEYIGRKVQRCGNSLISIGQPEEKSWPRFFETIFDNDHIFQVDIVSTLEELANYKVKEEYWGLTFSDGLVFLGRFGDLCEVTEKCDDLSKYQGIEVLAVKTKSQWLKVFSSLK